MKLFVGMILRVNKDGIIWVCICCFCCVCEVFWVYRRYSFCRVGNFVCFIFIEFFLVECYVVLFYYDLLVIKIRVEFWSMDLFSKINNLVFIIFLRVNYDVICWGNWIEYLWMWIDFVEFNVFL